MDNFDVDTSDHSIPPLLPLKKIIKKTQAMRTQLRGIEATLACSLRHRQPRPVRPTPPGRDGPGPPAGPTPSPRGTGGSGDAEVGRPPTICHLLQLLFRSGLGCLSKSTCCSVSRGIKGSRRRLWGQESLTRHPRSINNHACHHSEDDLPHNRGPGAPDRCSIITLSKIHLIQDRKPFV